MKITFWTVIFLIASVTTIYGQTDYKTYLTHRLTFNAFEKISSDANSKGQGLNKLPRGIEFSVGRRLSQGFRLNLPLNIGFAKASDDTTGTGRTFLGGGCQLTFEYPQYRIVPYFSTGLSYQRRLNQSDIGVPFAAGLNIRIDENAAINIQSLYRQSFKSHSNSWHYGIGLVFQLGKIPFKGSHTEGVNLIPRKKAQLTEELDIIGWWQKPLFFEELPVFPSPLNLPIADIDNDNVPDVLDDCPMVKGLVENKGCPKEVDLSWLQNDNNIAFEFGKSSLAAESFAFLDKIVLFLTEQPQIKMSLQGHTDSRGSSVFNQKLSEMRAKTCFDYLVGKGINVERLGYSGFGERQPIADNANEAGRSKNRRAAFIVVKID